MRILLDGHTLYDHFPGIGRHTYQLIESLATLAPHDSIVVPLNPRLPNRRFDLAQLRRFSNVSLVETTLTPFNVPFPCSLRNHPSRVQFDVAHFPYYMRPYIGYARSVVTIHDLTPTLFPQTLPTRAHALLSHWLTWLAIRVSRHVFTTSEASQRDLQRIFNVKPNDITITHNAVDAHFTPATTQAIAALRAKFQLPEQFILTLSINKPHKNLPTVLHAFAQLESDAHLVLAGFHDPRFPDSRAHVAQLGIGERVRFLGPMSDDDLPVLYSAATVFAFPSLYEGFGIPALEAMACGTPVVCSNSSSLPEVVGDAALLVNPYDVAAWRDALQRALDDDPLRAQMRERGLQQVTKFSWAETACRAHAAYVKLCEIW
jgi:alpha-1,3-rhamnosyl/mannosyltransferase